MRLEFESEVSFFTVKIRLKIDSRECQGGSRVFLLLIKHAWFAASQAIKLMYAFAYTAYMSAHCCSQQLAD